VGVEDAQLRAERRPHGGQTDHRGAVAARLVRVRVRSRVRVRDRVGVGVRVRVTLAPWAGWHGLEQMGKLSVIAYVGSTWSGLGLGLGLGLGVGLGLGLGL